MLVEIYNCSESYRDNYLKGPQGIKEALLTDQELSSGGCPYRFLDFDLKNPLGVPAGPLLNSLWVESYLRLGFCVPVYKTVRSVFRASHEPPNCLFVESPEFGKEALERPPELVTGPEPERVEELSITNSFGVPSMTPAEWMEDAARAKGVIAGLGPGRILIVSVLGTQGAEGRSLEADFAYTASMAREAGADVIELNYSCPNLLRGKSGMLYADPEASARISAAVRKSLGSGSPLLLKMGYLAGEALSGVVQANRPFVDGFAGINTVPALVRNPDGSQGLPGDGRLRSGICGAAIRRIGQDFVRELAALREARRDDFVIVGVGGMMTPADWDSRLAAGADLVMSGAAAMWDPGMVRRWTAARPERN